MYSPKRMCQFIRSPPGNETTHHPKPSQAQIFQTVLEPATGGKSQQSLIQTCFPTTTVMGLRMSLFTLNCNLMVPPTPYTRLSLFSPKGESMPFIQSLLISFLICILLKGHCISQNIYSCKWQKYISLGKKGEPLAHIPGHSCPAKSRGPASCLGFYFLLLLHPPSLFLHPSFHTASLSWLTFLSPIGRDPWPQCPREGGHLELQAHALPAK